MSQPAGRGVVAARSLFSGNATDTCVRVLNCDDDAHLFHEGEMIAVAEPVEAVENREPRTSAEPALVSAEGRDLTVPKCIDSSLVHCLTT